MDEITGITVTGLHLLTPGGIDSGAPAWFDADTVDQLMASGSWGRGTLHRARVTPRPERWPQRWRILAEPPDGA